ncbi:MAG TPA: ATP synthase F0 subunit B [Candidatus Onthomonas avicola]|nr:ATP synthase F0 subunit B [Candidatus Onthomonas avicola]
MNIPLNIDLQQILLHLFNFVILAGGLYLLLYRPVKEFIAKREAHYQSMEREAAEKLARAEALEAEHQQRLNAVEQELRERRTQATQELARTTEVRLAEARDQADKIISDARETARREHDKIMGQTQKELVDLAVIATEKLALNYGGNYDQFLDLAERGEYHGES